MKLVSNLSEVSFSFAIGPEHQGESRARNALLDRTMAPNWRKKSSNALRRGYLPSRGLALVARDPQGTLIGTVRLWDVASQNNKKALLLGPLAVDSHMKSSGVGTALMHAAIAKASTLGHGAILLVGDAAYYSRFGFSADMTSTLAMPGPFEPDRFLALELTAGALDGASGLLVPMGRKRSDKSQDKNTLLRYALRH